MSTLYEIGTQYEELLERITNGEIPEEAIADTLEGMAGDFKSKIEATACYIKELKAEAEAIKSEEDSLAERRKSKENSAKRFREGIMEWMKRTGVKKVDMPRARVTYSARVGTGLEISDDANIPPEYFVEQQPKLDRRGLLEAVKAGTVIPGVSLKSTESVTIK